MKNDHQPTQVADSVKRPVAPIQELTWQLTTK